MAFETVDFYLKADDGWTLVADDPNYILVRPDIRKQWALAITASGAPAGDVSVTNAFVFTGNPSNGETFIVGEITYRVVTAISAETPGDADIVIGGGAEATIDAIAAVFAGRAEVAAVAASGTVTYSSTGPVGAETLTVGATEYTYVAALTAADSQILIGGSLTATADNTAAAINGRAAFGTITLSSTGPVDGETFSIGGRIYTFVDALSGAEYEVEIGGTNDETATNIAASINGAGSPVHPLVSALAASAVVTATARAIGTSGNAIQLTESATNVAVTGSGTLIGGCAANGSVTAERTDTAIVTVTAIEAGFDGNAIVLTEAATNTAVSGSGTLAGGANAVPAIPINADASAAKTAADTLTFTARAGGVVGNEVPISESLTNVTMSGTTLAGGVDAVSGITLGGEGANALNEFRQPEGVVGEVYVRVLVDDSRDPVHFGVIRDQA